MPFSQGTELLLIALLVQAWLMILLLFALGGSRFATASSGKAKRGADGNLIFPERVEWLSACVNNQFQVPLLFFAAALLAMQLNMVSTLFAILAIIFVVFRVIHAAIFVTTNHIMSRFGTFLISALAVLGMWALLTMRILAA